MIYQTSLIIPTPGRGTIDITSKIDEFVFENQTITGICNVFNHHTSASLIICENYDPTVQTDLETITGRLFPDGDPLYKHTAEGPDDMTGHARTVFTHSNLTVPIIDSKLGLGTWQGIFLWEHRTSPHERKLTITVTE